MGKIIKLGESDLKKIVLKVIEEQENNEGIFDGVRDAYQGAKGVWRGEGYDYFKYVSSLSGLTKRLKHLDEPNKKVMKQLQDLKNKISSSKMPQDKKNNLSNAIDQAESFFNSYQNAIDRIEAAAAQRLN